MGEKVYKPIVNDGNHLIRSKDNPDRVKWIDAGREQSKPLSLNGKNIMSMT